jgi:hypothetical protein
MKKLIAMLLAATFAAVSINAIAQDKPKDTTKKPTAQQCKDYKPTKDKPMLEGCPKPAAK